MHSGTHGVGRGLWPGRVLIGRYRAVLCAAAVGVVSLGIYLATLAPGLTWAHDGGDGAELAAAARLLGIPHPPGYPSYMLLAHLFTLLPLGEIATRTNLLSALSAAGASTLLAWALSRWANRWVSAIGAGLALACAPLLWAQAVITDVHALNGLFTSALLALAVVADQKSKAAAPGRGWLALVIGGAWGLSLGNHLTAVFLAPLVLGALWRLGRHGLAGVPGILFGLAVYLYLPVRAAAGPLINWGNPRTLGRLWWMLTGGEYHRFVFSLSGRLWPARLAALSGLLTRQFGVVGLMVAALGCTALWTRHRPILMATAIATVLCVAFAVGYGTTDSYTYLIPALVSGALWLGTGIEEILAALDARARWSAHAAGAAVVGMLAIAIVCRFRALDLSSDRSVYEFRATVLDPAPGRAVLVSQQDEQTFALWYFTYALGLRPDVVVVDLDLLQYDWYTAGLPGNLGEEALSSLANRDVDAKRTATLLARPVCRIEAAPVVLTCVEP